MAAPIQLTRMHKVLIAVVVSGAVVIAGIGFAGSYAAVRKLALEKGFGNFAYVFPVGIDAGICVLLSLDLLLTWIRIPFPLLRQTAWILTAATIAFNGAAAWPDPLGVGMHAVIPMLFVVAVEAARHAIGRIADITADKHMEGVRLTRWLLSPLPTFLLWRRMKLWELRSYEQVIKLEQERLVYQARLRSRFGRAWRRKAPVESLMPLRLARYGVPLAQTAPNGLAAAGIEPAVMTVTAAPPVPAAHPALDPAAEALPPGATAATTSAQAGPQAGPETGPQALADGQGQPVPGGRPGGRPGPDQSPWFKTPREVDYQGGYDPSYNPDEQYEEWYEDHPQDPRGYADQYPPDFPPDFQDPNGFQDGAGYEEGPRYLARPGGRPDGRPDGRGEYAPNGQQAPQRTGQQTEQQTEPQARTRQPVPQQPVVPSPRSEVPSGEYSSEDTGTFPVPAGPGRTRELGTGGAVEPTEEDYYLVFKKSIDGSYPTSSQLRGDVEATYGIRLPQRESDRMLNRFTNRHTAELQDDHIA